LHFFHLYARTPIRFSFLFTRWATPQVRNLGMYLVCWQLFLLPTITPGVECALDLFCRHGEEFPWVPDQLQSRSLVIYKAWEWSRCFHQELSTCSEMYNGRKVNIKKLLQISFPTHQESSLLKTHTRKYGRNIERCASEISLGQLHRRSKISTSLLFGTRFMRMMARWKDNLMNFNLEGCLSTYYVLEVK
jgi:hypothetical protein